METVIDKSMTRPKVVRSLPDRIVLHHVPFDVYQRLRAEESNWGVRMAYIDGDLELTAPSQSHGEIEWRFGLFLMELARALGFQCKPLGKTTWSKPGALKAKEPDGAYYLQSFEQVRHKKIDLTVDPPPDLAIEVEISRSALNALSIYEFLEIPEIWRFDGELFQIHLRQTDGSYRESSQSVALPFLKPEEVVFWMTKAEEEDDDSEWLSQVNAWAFVDLLPRIEHR
jgi:Uma2 family endonuclease